VKDGREKCYIGNEQNDGEVKKLISAIWQLRDRASRKVERIQAEKQKERLAQLQNAEPFRANNKWGLRLDGRVIVPPIYRSIKEPVGDYCAVELSPQRWGVIQLDGKLIVDTCYHDVEIGKNGTVSLTIFPGKTMNIKLRK